MAKSKDSLNYSALRSELKNGEPANLYMLWGPEDYLIADFLNLLRDRCVEPEQRDFNLKRFNAPLPPAEDIEEAINAMPFFGGRTLVELIGFDINRCKENKRYEELLGDIPEWCTVVITLPTDTAPDGRLSLIKTIKKNHKAVEFTPQDSSALYQWIDRRVRAHGKTIDRNAMERLVFLSGDLMNRLIPEIEKVCGYASGERVTLDDVNAVAHHIPEASAFEMTNCISKGDYNGAAHYLAELISQNMETANIFGAIGWQMRRLYAARLAMDEHKSDAYLKDVLSLNNDYQLRMLKESAGRFSLRSLTNDVRHVAEYYYRTRDYAAPMEDNDALKELLLRFITESRHA